MTLPMTKTQQAALAFMAAQPRGETNGYTLKINGLGTTATLNQLCARGYCRPVGMGHSAFPANGTWEITPAGRAALTA